MDIQLVYTAKIYARAFLNVFADDISAKDFDAICLFAQFLANHRRALFFFGLPHITFDDKLKIIDQLVKQFKLPKELKKLLTLLVERGKAQIMDAVIDQVCEQYQLLNHIEPFEISSSHELKSAQLKEITAMLERATKNTVPYSYRIDKNLIAGLRAQSKTKLWEYSIAKQLQILAGTAYR
jgi:ATP synthase F1 delta subunit